MSAKEKQSEDEPEAYTGRWSIVSTIADHFDIPCSPEFFFSVRGAENVHIYLWIMKDLGWTSGNELLGMTAGVAALAWVGVLLSNALAVGCTEDAYMLVPLFLWLFGNFWWMEGEFINDDDDVQGPQAGDFMIAGACFLGVYYIFLKPYKVLKADPKMKQLCLNEGLIPRFTYFESWRQYEHFHTLCWLAKDLSWDQNNPYTYVIFMIPTVLIAADFIYVSITKPKMLIDGVHYIAQLCWVLANAVWSMGELFYWGPDNPLSLFIFNKLAFMTSRWWSAWILFVTLLLLALFYFVWLPLSYYGKIRADAELRLTESRLQQKMQRSADGLPPLYRSASGLGPGSELVDFSASSAQRATETSDDANVSANPLH